MRYDVRTDLVSIVKSVQCMYFGPRLVYVAHHGYFYIDRRGGTTQAPRRNLIDLNDFNSVARASLGIGLCQEEFESKGSRKRRDRRPEGASFETEPQLRRRLE
ncbi:jg10571 [Pararge aegeria aegeria]|uniref:Jg10571 protein n=1 Tax=Pararge aegeria aegeria TaxID=348720 RepID=A0A8S4RDQ5_9NEOP|nr:jg10571 [Pararge aegeria aegeria]